MKVLIFGSKGWIGNQFINVLKNVGVEYVESVNRAENFKSIEEEIKNSDVSHIVSLIGRTHGEIDGNKISTIDYLEEEGKLVDNIRDNLYSPLNLALVCNKYNKHFTYLGTGCIFEYEDEFNRHKFSESDEPNFFGSSYSIVKGFTDKIMREFSGVLNLRIRMPITDDINPRNFITKITNYAKICSKSNSMTVLPELLPYVVRMMNDNVTGTYNLTNPGVITHNEILEMYREIVDPLFVWKNFSIEEQDTILKSKRSNNELDTSKLKKLIPELKSIKDSVRDCLNRYPKPVYDFENTDDTVLLVTGGYGFIGSNFINYMYEKYDKINIVNIDYISYNSNIDNVHREIQESSRYIFLKKNLVDLKLKDIEELDVTHIVNFAAQSHVNHSFNEPMLYVNDNISGTVQLIEVVKKYGKVKKMIHISTDEVYGESELDEIHKNEHTLLCPTNPYSGTKSAAEMMVNSYIYSYNLPILITRGNNVYGKNQYKDKLIPKFIDLLKNDKPVTIEGSGESLRSFLYIDDTVRAFEVLLLKGNVHQVYNIGTDNGMEYSVIDISKILIEKIKGTTDYDKWITYIDDRPFNDKRYFISNDKLKNLGWKICTDFDTGIDNCIGLE